MPNRLIKSSIHESDRVNGLTDFQFRVWVSLITYVDDFGRGDARPKIIKGNCFPLRDSVKEKDIRVALSDLAEAGCISLYEVDGKPYLYFPNWEKHQNIRNKTSKFPAPNICNQLKANEFNCDQSPANAPVIQSESELESESELKEERTPLETSLDEFREYRKQIGAKLTPLAEKKLINELDRLSGGNDSVKIRLLDQSIRNGWKGVFPLKDGHGYEEHPAQNYNRLLMDLDAK